jgi:hypothetical protein
MPVAPVAISDSLETNQSVDLDMPLAVDGRMPTNVCYKLVLAPRI